MELLRPQHTRIITMPLQIVLESLILLLNHVLSDIRQPKERDHRAEDAQAAADPEWILTLFDSVVSCSINQEREL